MKTEQTDAMRERIKKVFEITAEDVTAIEANARRNEIIALAAFKKGQSNPKIKQLEWEEVWEGYEDAKTPFGHYVVRPSIDNKIFLMIDLRKGIEPYSTLSEAKSAAQTDFEKRVKECLE